MSPHLKNTLALFLAAVLLLAGAGISLALGDGNYRKGKYLFRKECRVCHSEEAGKAKDLSPNSLTQAEWAAAFQPETAAGYPCYSTWQKLKESDLNDIYTYMYNFAKDSPTPAKCK
ncbi:MAG: cytochrome c [Deltaproteobacteria bacterium]|nr:cytochrome c [Deltaproteobacteria bacterium]